MFDEIIQQHGNTKLYHPNLNMTNTKYYVFTYAINMYS